MSGPCSSSTPSSTRSSTCWADEVAAAAAVHREGCVCVCSTQEENDLAKMDSMCGYSLALQLTHPFTSTYIHATNDQGDANASPPHLESSYELTFHLVLRHSQEPAPAPPGSHEEGIPRTGATPDEASAEQEQQRGRHDSWRCVGSLLFPTGLPSAPSFLLLYITPLCQLNPPSNTQLHGPPPLPGDHRRALPTRGLHRPSTTVRAAAADITVI